MITTSANRISSQVGRKCFPPAIEAAMIDAQRNIANARLLAFEDECFRLGEALRPTPDHRVEVADFLHSVAEAHGLARAHSEGLIHLMIIAGLRGDA